MKITRKQSIKNLDESSRLEGFGKYRYNIPMLTMSGGKAHPKDCLRFRVWIKRKRGDSFFWEYNTLAVAIEGRARLISSKKYLEVEDVIGVVWDNKFCNFREVALA